MVKPNLNHELLQLEAEKFAKATSQQEELALFGVTDGKAVGTYLEQKFRAHLRGNYTFIEGNTAGFDRRNS